MKTTAFFILLMTLVTVACSKESKQQEEWFDHGDPESLIEGVKGKNEMSVDDFESLVGWFPYREKTIGRRFSKRSAGDGNEFVSSLALTELAYKVVPESTATGLTLKGERGNFRLEFAKNQNGELRLHSYRGRTARLLHFSRHPQRQMVTLLLRLGDTNLAEITFMTNEEIGDTSAAIPTENAIKYSFSFGREGRWREQSLTISLCGFPGDREIQLANRALGKWQAALGDRLKLRVQVFKRGFVPFSDLNVHCIYWDRQFKPAPHSTDLVIGRTIVTTADGERSIVDADAFIYASELNKQIGDEEQKVAQLKEQIVLWGILHEIGHMLGLHHPHADTNSVMTSKKLVDLQPFDIEAIQALYSK